MKNKNSVMISIILVVLALLLGVYFIVSSRIDAKYTPNYNLDDFYKYPEKTLGVNEYKVVSVQESDMIKTYFSAYARLLMEDINDAYNHLDDNTGRTYPNIDSFKNKVGSLTNNFTKRPVFSSYTIENTKENIVYKIKDTRGNIYIFTVEAVMKYTVSF